MSRPFNIPEDALGVLSRLAVSQEDGFVGRITDGQIPKDLYVSVNKALEALGGKWNRKARGHVFPSDPSEALDNILLTGTVENRKQALGFFETPAGVAKKLVELAGVTSGMRVLEPSAGDGAIVAELPEGCALVSMVEIDPQHRVNLLRAPPRNATIVLNFGDFLTMDPTEVYGGPLASPFDAVVMNPPFANQADILHVTHAFEFLRPGGRLAAVMSAGVRFREDKRAREFRRLVDQCGGTIESLPAGTFKESGTDVHTVMVGMEK